MATVVESALPGPELAKAAPNPAKIARRCLPGGLVGAFVIPICMFQTFDGRILIVPVLSLGFVALYWVPVLFGFLASSDLRAPSDPGGRPSVAQVAV
ncbi:MAG TPA: hypothetical protein ENH15_01850, partial [Actinobacteria bacterium]|nr:hypothetical protein [Actinomycetota bacterium]